TAVSAIVFFLGLLFGFQRPSRLLLPRLRATVFFTSRLHPVQLRGRLLYFEPASLSSDRCRSVSPLRPDSALLGAVALRFPFREGRGIYCFSASAVNPLRRLSSSRRLDFVALATSAVSRGCGFYHRRVGSQLRSLTFYFVFHCFVGGLRRQCDFAFPSEGRGFYHHRVESQPLIQTD
ncbi:hypothetical protein, partial [Vitiosangium sp. GDMCC 1.1324]|uniref:hypothetical protein n=1 Tax=Vitiosangium sp. (strain GDMCC 1.1324) TaxID=2138576 RepID=UPI001E2AEBBA